MTYDDRINFVEELINQWECLEECSPIEYGFKCRGCSALFIEDGFNVHFGFYDPDGQKLAEYTFNAETGVAIMRYDARYAKGRNGYTGILADILGGIVGKRYFRLINKPVVVYTDATEPMSFKDIVTDVISRIIKEDDANPSKT